MKEDPFLKAIKKLSRQYKLEKWMKVGRIKSKTWGGKPSTKKNRINSKSDLRKEY